MGGALPSVPPQARMLLPFAVLLGCLMFAYPLYAQGQRADVRPWMPDIVSEFPNVRDIAISPEGDEYYFTVESFRKEFSTIVMVKRENGRWSTPTVAPFAGQYRDLEPAFSPNGNTLFFVSTRPVDEGSSEPKDYDIWYVTRQATASQWSAPLRVAPPVSSPKNEFYPSVTTWGDLYFTREADDAARKEDIFVSRLENGAYTAPQALSDAVNSNRYEFNAFVAPDESYLLFTSYAREDDRGGGDLYISYRKNGDWTPAQHLGNEINSNTIDYCPFVDTRNGILYFTSERSSVRTWFDAPQELGSLLRDFRSGSFGAGRIYMVNFPSASRRD